MKKIFLLILATSSTEALLCAPHASKETLQQRMLRLMQQSGQQETQTPNSQNLPRPSTATQIHVALRNNGAITNHDQKTLLMNDFKIPTKPKSTHKQNHSVAPGTFIDRPAVILPFEDTPLAAEIPVADTTSTHAAATLLIQFKHSH